MQHNLGKINTTCIWIACLNQLTIGHLHTHSKKEEDHFSNGYLCEQKDAKYFQWLENICQDLLIKMNNRYCI